MLQLGARVVAAELVDVSEAGFHCVIRGPYATPPVGRRVAAPFTMSTPRQQQRIDINVNGAVKWRRAVDGTTHLGLALDPLDDDQRIRIRRFLAAAGGSGT